MSEQLTGDGECPVCGTEISMTSDGVEAASLRASEEKLAVATTVIQTAVNLLGKDRPMCPSDMSESQKYELIIETACEVLRDALSLISNPSLLDLVSAREKVIAAAPEALAWLHAYRVRHGTKARDAAAELSRALIDYHAALKAVTEKA